MRSTHDLSTRARIRDAAIDCFGREGFDVPLRSIASRAGTSTALIIHHFGSKDGLRAACNEHVTETVRAINESRVPVDVTADRLVRSLLEDSEAVEQYGWLIGYLLRSFQAGGDFTRAMFDALVADTADYLARAEAAGLVESSRDPLRRARWMVASRVGMVLVLLTLSDGDIDYERLTREWTDEFMLPVLEVYTHGIFTDSTVLDTYVSTIAESAEEHP